MPRNVGEGNRESPCSAGEWDDELSQTSAAGRSSPKPTTRSSAAAAANGFSGWAGLTTGHFHEPEQVYTVMAYVVVACIIVGYEVMACIGMAYEVMAYTVDGRSPLSSTGTMLGLYSQRPGTMLGLYSYGKGQCSGYIVMARDNARAA